MKLTVNRSAKAKALPIPGAVLAVSDLAQTDSVEFHTGENTVVALPAKMTAMELVNTIHTLHELTVDLSVTLAKSCGTCDECGLCESIGLESGELVVIPDHVLEEAGLPFGCKLVACVDENGNILVEPAGYDHDLNDVPDHILNSLGECGICLADLEDRIMLGDIVYDATKQEESEENYLC